ncbi:hypothetical protein P4534_01070 [Peribacillus butanolivorans]|uniref:hypothetical protein n=1 Tax=Peribacillus butanolivorans TaxID=421767 RepID=UPI002E1E0031|nr:hypothetical protein [Peribacillus butanolivorans]
MKIFGITILMLILLVAFSLSMDILLGFDIENSIKHAFNPFLVKDVAELVLFLFLLVMLLFSFFYRRKKKGNKAKGQQ